MVKKFFIIAAILAIAAQAFSATQHWTGAGGDDNFFNPLNWSTNAVPGMVTNNDTVRIGDSTAYSPDFWPVYNGTMIYPTTGQIRIGYVKDASFTMAGGTYIHNSWVSMGRDGTGVATWYHNGGTFFAENRQFTVGSSNALGSTLYMKDGLLHVGDYRMAAGATELGYTIVNGGEIRANQMQLGMLGVGNLQMYGGSMNTLYAINIGSANTTGSTYANIYGGVFKAGTLELYRGSMQIFGGDVYGLDALAPMNLRSQATVNIAGGTLWLNGDQRANVADWISNMRLFTSIPGYAIIAEYDTGENYTKIYAGVIPEPSGIFALAAGITGVCGALLRRRK